MCATFLTGGLNHQIEHHLFPSLAAHHLPLIHPAVVQVCRRHGVCYHSMGFCELVRDCHRTLRQYGSEPDGAGAAFPNLRS